MPNRLTRLSLTCFRNYAQSDFVFADRVVAVCGLNGTGKTNLLDAVHYLCLTKSYFSRNDPGSVQRGAQGFRISGEWETGEGLLHTACILRENGRKEFQAGGVALTRFSSHVGRIPVVFVAPDDVQLIIGGAEERRRLLDTILSQMDPEYLQALIRYNRVLQERNGLLRSASETGRLDVGLLDVLDMQLSAPGDLIHAKRRALFESYGPSTSGYYDSISGGREAPVIRYTSPLAEMSMSEWLSAGRREDIAAQRTRQGIHRDDIDIVLDDAPFRLTASQGQRKSMLFAMKLAEFGMLEESKGSPPVLLLDDVFEKLDGERMGNLLYRVCRENKGQVFLTDTHTDRMRAILADNGVSFQSVEL
jgi:DNA replication and repair protein RecF